MSTLRFEIEWLEAPGVRAEELRATWCRLELWIGEDCVSLVEDAATSAARHSIYVPLYPLAEWVAYHWWAIVSDRRSGHLESESVVANRTRRFRRSLRGAGDGFSWPDLTFSADETIAALTWRADWQRRSGPIRYLSSGEQVVDRRELIESLSTLIDVTLQRLAEQGVAGTTLAKEWEALQSLLPEEAEFADAVARLGLDPFDVPADLAGAVLDAGQALPGEVLIDFFNSVEPDAVATTLRWVVSAQQEIEELTSHPAESIEGLRSAVRHLHDGIDEEPWAQGYAAAQKARAFLSLPATESFDVERYVGVGFHPAGNGELTGGVQALGKEDRVGCRMVLRRPGVSHHPPAVEQQRFASARGLWNAIATPTPDHLFLLTTARTQRQRAGRAFAAELLAPLEGIASLMPGEVDADGAVEEVAAHFAVSPLLVQLQLDNARGRGQRTSR
jgi:hypothetical protein